MTENTCPCQEELQRLRKLEDRIKRKMEFKVGRLNEAASAYSYAYNNDLDARANEAMHQVVELSAELEVLKGLLEED